VSYRIRISPAAQKEILALPGYVRAEARQTIRALGENPLSSRARELRERPRVFRIWLAGRWRIVYEVDDDLKMVLILCVRLKENIDYASL
jgi:mRNA-degrading endonuclease RelE of RelBE toxin-antitoxin system